VRQTPGAGDRWGGPPRRRGPRALAAGALGFTCLAALLAVQQAVGGDGDGTAGTSIPACRELDLDGEPDERVTCRTDTATLTIVGRDQPLVLEDTELRVTSFERAGRTASVRTRYRNTADRNRGAGTIRRQVYLRVGDSRVSAEPVDREVGPGETATLTLRFRLGETVAARLARDEARPELGVVPRNQLDEAGPTRRGVVRLATT
jgi:hypothetical protein